jgi:hypothetical protein
MKLRRFALSVSVLILGSASLFGQTQSASLLGTVVDPAGAVIASAPVTVTNQGTAAVRTATTEAGGLFRVTNIFAGTYSVKIEAKGFKTLTVRDIEIVAGDSRDLGKLTLELGSVSDSISVTAEAAAVQTATSERAPLLEAADINSLAIKGRDMMSYMKTLPGVVDTATGRDAAGGSVLGGLTFSGSTGITAMSVDGATDIDTGCSSCFAHFEPNIDAIGEIKVLTSSFAAEYGRNSGATISVTTKSGTQEFHGSGWWTHRHENFNANLFFNNQTGTPLPRYRYNIAGWSLGGPVYIPKHFNVNKTKIFAFASQEYTNQLVNAATQYRAMPTANERTGDFSQSILANGALIKIIDPSTGVQFPGNVIPSNRFNGWGQAMLNFFPLPNSVFGPGTAQFQAANYQASASGIHPRRNDIIRIDVNATSKLNGFFRYGNDKDESDTLFSGVQFPGVGINNHPNPGTGYIGTVNYTFSPTLVNQATYNFSYNYFSYYEEDPTNVARTILNGATGTPQAGQPIPSLFPLHPLGPGTGGDMLEGPGNCSNGYCNYMPSFSFGSTPPNAASFAIGNTADYVNTNRIKQFSDNLSKVWGNHNFKTGIYAEYNRKLQPGGINYLGSYNFTIDSNNPNNTGNGYANGLLGQFSSYSETSGHFVYDVYYWNTEFYFQDDWRIGKRFTLNYGVRFYHVSPQIDKLNEFSYLDPSKFSKSAIPRFYAPGCKTGTTCPSGQNRVAIDPATGAQAPQTYIGLFVPGTGNPANGMVVDGVGGVPLDTYTNAYIVASPRIGFSLDVFGDGKTALRGGWGTFYDRLDGNQVYNMSGQPPIGYTPTVSYGSVATLASTTGALGSTNINEWNGYTPVPQNRTANIGLQRSFGGTLLDVSYQGTYGITRPVRVNLNAIPLYRNFDPAFADPTSPGGHLNNNLLRPNYLGIGTISQLQFLGKSRYDGLQVSVKRRLSKGLLWNVSYTWSHFFNLGSFDPLVADNYARNWGPSGNDRRHLAAISYAYDIPNLGKKLNNRALGMLTDGWNYSGIATFSSGSPFTPSFSWTDGRDITGSADEGARINVVGDPFANIPAGGVGLPHGKYWFNPAAFASPTVGQIGNAGVNYIYGPGYANYDMTLYKRINLGSDYKRNMQMRLEAFNVFNHTQFTGVNAGYTFAAATGLNTNANLGALTGERGPRVVSLELRVQF